MELLVVLMILSLLAGLAAPVVSGAIDRAREAALKENLHVLRKAIDDYYADTGAYPPTLETLVERRYVRNIPADPLAQSDGGAAWRLEPGENGKGISNVSSRSENIASDGSRYDTW